MYHYTDANSPRKGNNYCGVRALVLAEGMDWEKAEWLLRHYCKNGKAGNGALSKGIYKEDYNAALESLGYKWVAAPKFDGRKARAADLPPGKHIARMAGHYCCVIEGVVYDTWNSSNKMVYGYWTRDESLELTDEETGGNPFSDDHDAVARSRAAALKMRGE
jgi:hypothetical protein